MRSANPSPPPQPGPTPRRERFAQLLLAAVLTLPCLLPSSALAQSTFELRYYPASANSGSIDYHFELSQTVPSQTIGFLIVGDTWGSYGFSNATLVGPAPGPWTSLGHTTGGHAGAYLFPSSTSWAPTDVSEVLSFVINHAGPAIGDGDLRCCRRGDGDRRGPPRRGDMRRRCGDGERLGPRRGDGDRRRGGERPRPPRKSRPRSGSCGRRCRRNRWNFSR